ncbi:MAG: ribosome hibernation-promoting factor, HPF/YfiA family [Acidimicrobiales bacterium]
MNIAIRGRNVEVSDVLRSTVEAKVTRLGRFLEGMERAEVSFSEERNPRISERDVCEVTMHGHGHVVRARAVASDTFAAVDRVVDKLEHRMEKLKGKLIDRSHARRSPAGGPVPTTLAPDGAAAPNGRARISETKKVDMKPMTPVEAVLQMEAIGRSFWFFANADTDRPAVVYRRPDGSLTVIEGS